MKPLEIDFKANSLGSSYSWKIWGKCANSQQLMMMRTALIAYMDMKIMEARENEAPTP